MRFIKRLRSCLNLVEAIEIIAFWAFFIGLDTYHFIYSFSVLTSLKCGENSEIFLDFLFLSVLFTLIKVIWSSFSSCSSHQSREYLFYKDCYSFWRHILFDVKFYLSIDADFYFCRDCIFLFHSKAFSSANWIGKSCSVIHLRSILLDWNIFDRDSKL